MSAQRQKVIEQLLVEASDNDPRKVYPCSVRLLPNDLTGRIDWTEKTKRGLVARSSLVDWEKFWDLIDDALANPHREKL